MRSHIAAVLGLGLTVLITGCQGEEHTTSSIHGTEAAAEIECDPDNGGISLPEGFCAKVVADSLGPARHIAIRENGDLYVALREPTDGGAIVALRDTTGDGRFDRIERLGDLGGTGIGLWEGYLYFAPDTAVLRYPLPEHQLLPEPTFELIAGGLPERGQHASKPFTIDEAGNLYVTIGAPSNACQEDDRSVGSTGQDPCPLLERFGGIWRFRADEPGQTQEADGERFATGIRNAMALVWNPEVDQLYAVQHGRDMLTQNWGDLYTAEESAELPSEEFFLVEEGMDFGRPYCYYDQIQGSKVLAPEYGGDGTEVGRCTDAETPIVGFPGHWAPNDLVFYGGELFPETYRGGAFIAFHGSWNRAPLEQQGYNVAFVPFQGEDPSGEWTVFADGFAGVERIESTGDAQHRPMALAVGPDGSLYIGDSVQGRIWRVIYRQR